MRSGNKNYPFSSNLLAVEELEEAEVHVRLSFRVVNEVLLAATTASSRNRYKGPAHLFEIQNAARRSMLQHAFASRHHNWKRHCAETHARRPHGAATCWWKAAGGADAPTSITRLRDSQSAAGERQKLWQWQVNLYSLNKGLSLMWLSSSLAQVNVKRGRCGTNKSLWFLRVLPNQPCDNSVMKGRLPPDISPSHKHCASNKRDTGWTMPTRVRESSNTIARDKGFHFLILLGPWSDSSKTLHTGHH